MPDIECLIFKRRFVTLAVIKKNLLVLLPKVQSGTARPVLPCCQGFKETFAGDVQEKLGLF
jgi:hypothetical protein